MNLNDKIYIAGHNGLVGSAILKKLEYEKYDNLIYKSSKEVNLINQAETENFFSDNLPEYVFLAAAKVGGILANNTYKADFIYNNIMIASNIIYSSYKFNVKKLLNLGSSCIYPKNADIPIKEEYLLTGVLEQTNEPYAIAKIAAIKLCRYFNEQYNTDFISIMPNNLYGNNDNYNLETSHVIAAIIRKILIAKALKDGNKDFLFADYEKNKIGFGLESKYDGSIDSLIQIYKSLGITANEITLWGTGQVYREFLHNDDLADACLFVMNNLSATDIGEIVNVGYGSDITIKELAMTVKDVAGFNGEITFSGQHSDGTYRKLMDTTKLNNFGWKPSIDLFTGIRKVIDNYLN